MSIAVDVAAGFERRALGVEEFGELVPISRFGARAGSTGRLSSPPGSGTRPWS